MKYFEEYDEVIELGKFPVEDEKREVNVVFARMVGVERDSPYDPRYISDQWVEGIEIDGVLIDQSGLNDEDKARIKEFCQEYIDDHEFQIPPPSGPEPDDDR